MNQLGTVEPGYIPALPPGEPAEGSPDVLRAEITYWQIERLYKSKRDDEAYALNQHARRMGWI